MIFGIAKLIWSFYNSEMTPSEISNIKNITISGRIGAGSTTLATGLSQRLGWELLEGGELFQKIHDELNLSEISSNHRPDKFDLEYEETVKKFLKTKSHQVIQSHLAGFDAQEISGIYKILVVCEDEKGEDHPDIRIDRLVNRKKITVEEAKKEIAERETNNLEKWRRMYAGEDQGWVYWDPKYYDLIVNTYSHNKEESLSFVLQKLGVK